MQRSLVLLLVPVLAWAAFACSNEEDLGLDVAWPIAYSDAPDADLITAPFGYREQSGKLDFHAGVDFPIESGTKVRAIKAGVVEKTEYNSGTGTGKWVLVDHGDGEKSSYLHLSRFSVKAGDEVYAGQLLGRSGSTGTKSPHLHLTYMVGVEKSGANEDVARNPLELLPHNPMPEPTVTWEDDTVMLEIVLQPMTIQTIIVEGEGESRELDYAEIVALGNPDRDDDVQAGLRVEITENEPETGTFNLLLSPSGGAFTPTSVTAFDYTGELVLQATR